MNFQFTKTKKLFLKKNNFMIFKKVSTLLSTTAIFPKKEIEKIYFF